MRFGFRLRLQVRWKLCPAYVEVWLLTGTLLHSHCPAILPHGYDSTS